MAYFKALVNTIEQLYTVHIGNWFLVQCAFVLDFQDGGHFPAQRLSKLCMSFFTMLDLLSCDTGILWMMKCLPESLSNSQEAVSL